VQFGIRCSVAGTFYVQVANAAGDTSALGTITIAAGEVGNDVVKSITLAGVTTGTWLTTNGAGAQLNIHFINSGQTGNIFTAINNVFDLFDVGIYEGSAAPAFQVPDYAEELRACQRYYAKSYNQGTNPGALTTAGAVNGTQTSGASAVQYFPIVLPVAMRTNIAAATIYNPQVANAQVRNLTTSTDWTSTSFWGQGDRNIAISSFAPAGSAAGQAFSFHWVVNARM